MLKLSNPRRKKSSAQAMVEFALALPVLLLVVYGLLETGRLLFIYASVVTAARQAARYGSATGDNGSGTAYYNDCTGIRNAAKAVGFLQHFTDSDIVINYDKGLDAAGNPRSWAVTCGSLTGGNTPVNGYRIRVQVSSLYRPIVPLVPFGPINITSTSRRTLLVAASVVVSQPGQGFTGSGTGGLELTKRASQDTYDHVGQVISYNFTLKNNGTDSIDGPFWISDPTIAPDPGFLCEGVPTSLPGGLATIYACNNHPTYTITTVDIDIREVTNTARAYNEAKTSVSGPATYTISFVATPHIALSKTGNAPGTVDAGQPVHYTFVITNDGNVPLTNVSLSDTKIGSTASCPATTLDTGTSMTCTGTYLLKASDVSGGSGGVIINTATVTAQYLPTSTTVTASATANTPIPVLLIQNIQVSPNPVTAVNQMVTVTYTLLDRGTRNISSITITDTKVGTFTCSTTLVPGTPGTCSHTWQVGQNDYDFVTINSQASATGTQTSPSRTWISNNYPYTIATNAVAQLALTKTVATPTPGPSPVPFSVGQQLNYTYTLRNTGTVTLKPPYSVTDDKLTGIDCTAAATSKPTLAPGDSVSCAVKSYTLKQSDLDAGSVINHASATALNNASGATVTSDLVNKATAMVITYTGPRMKLQKIVASGTKAYFTAAGDQITYTYNFINTGGVDLQETSPYTLTDSKIGTITCGSLGTLAIGSTKPCANATYTVTGADYTLGHVDNTVGVAGGSTNPAAPEPPSTLSGVNLSVPKFNCTTTTVTHSLPAPIPGGISSVDWTIYNNTGAPIHIVLITLQWNSGGAIALTQVTLGGATIWSGSNKTGGPFTLPGVPSGGWTVPFTTPALPAPGTPTVLHLAFSTSTSGIQILVTFAEPSCNFSLNSNNP